MTARPTTRLTLATAPRPGAVAILQLVGPDAVGLAEQLTGKPLPRDGRLVLRRFADIDEGLACVLGSSDSPVVQLMPHGGPRVVQNITEALRELGAQPADDIDPRSLYPEAATALEADMLFAIAQAPSPAAIDVLASQPNLWREWVKSEEQESKREEKQGKDAVSADSELLLSCALAFLLSPPSVVVVGRPNVGKSTLTNTLLGRAVSIVSDLPGTTRDWVGSLAELGSPRDAVAVRWLDTPGLRDSADAVEQHAIELARRVIGEADVLIAMRDPEHDWPALDDLPRRPDLWVLNKADALASNPLPGGEGFKGCDIDHPLPISAMEDRGVTDLATLVRETLGLADLAPRRWAFSKTLQAHARGEDIDLSAYCGA